MLTGSWVPDDSRRIDFTALPRVPSQHTIASDVRAEDRHRSDLARSAGGVNQHTYLAHHGRKFWVMWSDGPRIKDLVGQPAKFATSRDGLPWTAPWFLTPSPRESVVESAQIASNV